MACTARSELGPSSAAPSSRSAAPCRRSAVAVEDEGGEVPEPGLGRQQRVVADQADAERGVPAGGRQEGRDPLEAVARLEPAQRSSDGEGHEADDEHTEGDRRGDVDPLDVAADLHRAAEGDEVGRDVDGGRDGGGGDELGQAAHPVDAEAADVGQHPRRADHREQGGIGPGQEGQGEQGPEPPPAGRVSRGDVEVGGTGRAAAPRRARPGRTRGRSRRSGARRGCRRRARRPRPGRVRADGPAYQQHHRTDPAPELDGQLGPHGRRPVEADQAGEHAHRLPEGVVAVGGVDGVERRPVPVGQVPADLAVVPGVVEGQGERRIRPEQDHRQPSQPRPDGREHERPGACLGPRRSTGIATRTHRRHHRPAVTRSVSAHGGGQ